MANLIGQRLGQYEIVAFLGKGGMATVYRARQASIDRDVAIKVIRPDLTGSEGFVKRFLREGKTIASLSHPHILKVFDFGQEGELAYLVMELLNGGSLADRIVEGALPLDLAAQVLAQVASALDYAHSRGIIHRDLKPQNVLLDETNNAHLTDFGIAKLLDETTVLTQSGHAMGTPAYMSPEQWRGDPLDSRVDVYALGVMMFEMLTGQLPYRGETPFSMMHKHVNEPLPSLRSVRPDLPRTVEDVLARAMAKDREQRFAQAGQISEAFRNALAATPAHSTRRHGGQAQTPESEVPTAVGAPPAGPSAPDQGTMIEGSLPTVRSSRRGGVSLPLLIVGGLALLGLAALLLIAGRQPGAATQEPATRVAQAAETTTASPTVVTITAAATTGQALPTGTALPPTATALPATLTSTTAVVPTGDGALLPTQTVVPPTATALAPALTPTPTSTTAPTSTHTPPPTATTNPPTATAVPPTPTPTNTTAPTSTHTPPPTATAILPTATAAPPTLTPTTVQTRLVIAPDQVVYSGHKSWVTSVAFSPDGQTLITGSRDYKAKLWKTATGEELATLSGHKGALLAVAFSPDGKYVVTGAEDATARLWDAATGQPVRTFSGHRGFIFGVAFSPDGKYVLTASQDGTARFWETASGASVRTLAPHTGWAIAAAFSPDGQYALTGSAEGKARLWDASTAQLVRTFTGHTQPVRSVAFSPDGTLMATGSADKLAKLWDVQTGQELRTLSGHRDWVFSVAFSPDGKYLLTGAKDETAKLWDVQTGQEVKQFGMGGWISGVAFSPDGQYILTGSGADQIAKLWRIKLS